MKRILSIDFGTSTTVISDTTYNDSFEPRILEINGFSLIDSVVQMNADDGIDFYGYEALQRAEKNPDQTIIDFKLGIHNAEKYTIKKGNKEKIYTAKEVSIHFLSLLKSKLENTVYNKSSLNEIISKTIIGFPAEWTEAERAETVEIARKAGYPNVSGCFEPEGAIYYLHYDGIIDLEERKNTVLYDFGGGTLDVSSIIWSDSSNEFKISTISSELIGGRYFDLALYNYFYEEIRKLSIRDLCGHDKLLLRLKVKELKEKLSKSDSSCECTIPFVLALKKQYTLRITKNIFENLCKDLIEKSLYPIISAVNYVNNNKIDRIILTGGSSNFYFIHDAIMKSLPSIEIINDNSPQISIAKGLALYGRKISTNKIYKKNNITKNKILNENHDENSTQEKDISKNNNLTKIIIIIIACVFLLSLCKANTDDISTYERVKKMRQIEYDKCLENLSFVDRVFHSGNYNLCEKIKP